jgi:uncharacterized protein YkwD
LSQQVAAAAVVIVVAVAGPALAASEASASAARDHRGISGDVARAGPAQDLDYHIYVPLAPNGFGRGPDATQAPPATPADPSVTPTRPGDPAATYTPEPPTETPAPSTATPSVTPIPGPEWLAYVNQYRAAAQLGPVREFAELSDGAVLHSRYMVKTGLVDHIEDPSNSWWTEAGARAGRNGNIYVSGFANVGHRPPIDMWMAGPFHMLGIIDPRLSETGYGDFSEEGVRWDFGATIDVLSKRERSVEEADFPVLYPGAGSRIWNLAYQGNETPNPLTSCTGYGAPSGPPLAVQLGTGNVAPAYVSSRLFSGGRELEHCVFDQTSYRNPDSGLQDLGRGILRMRSAVIIMPREPLVRDQTYDVEMVAGGRQMAWSFTTSSTGLRAAPPGVIR